MRFFLSIFLFLALASSGFSQTQALAENYFEQGEYEKALSIYQQLYEKNPNNIRFLQGMVAAHQEMGQYSEAIKLLMQKVVRSSNHPDLLVELGYNQQLLGDLQAANEQYEKAIAHVAERPFFAYSVGEAFLRHNLLDEAAKTYEAAMEEQPNTNFTIQLARIYGEQGKTEKMFGSYLQLVEQNPNLFHTVNRFLGQYITDDPLNEANQVFRKLLLKKLQENPNVLYNQMLSWLFVQQKDFKNAFVQEKAISIRSDGDLDRIFDLAFVAKDEKKFETAIEILNYIIENSLTEEAKLKAYALLMEIKTENAEEKEYDEVQQKFQELFAVYGKGPETIFLQIGYADFLAFQLGQKQQGIDMLKDLISKNIGVFAQAKAKTKLADILVLDGKFNQALIYYSQVQQLVKNDVLAQEARFKVALTSYYKGDFDWALLQLDVLKASTSQLIANDAMELSLLIKDNSLEDSTRTALKLFAKADLYTFQKKNEEALSTLGLILENHQGESIIDEALLRKAEILEGEKQYEEAAAAYQKIIADHKDGILADNAYFGLAELYRTKLDRPEKAKENYEQIIFNHEDSIYFVEARKKFRELRGDAVE